MALEQRFRSGLFLKRIKPLYIYIPYTEYCLVLLDQAEGFSRDISFFYSWIVLLLIGNEIVGLHEDIHFFGDTYMPPSHTLTSLLIRETRY